MLFKTSYLTVAAQLFSSVIGHGTQTFPPSRGMAWAWTGIIQNVHNGQSDQDAYKRDPLEPHMKVNNGDRKTPICSMGLPYVSGKDEDYYKKTDQFKHLDSQRLFQGLINNNGAPLPSYPGKIRTGWNEFNYYVFAGHPTHKHGYLDVYITNDGYNYMRENPVTFGDLDPEPIAHIEPDKGNDWGILGSGIPDDDGINKYFKVKIPKGKKGIHVIYMVWQNDHISKILTGHNVDHDRAWYSCSDVQIVTDTEEDQEKFKSSKLGPSVQKESDVKWTPGSDQALFEAQRSSDKTSFLKGLILGLIFFGAGAWVYRIKT